MNLPATLPASLSAVSASGYAAFIAEHIVEVGECHEWTGRMGCGGQTGVPIIKARRDGGQTHNLIVPRLVWEQANGPIPDGRIVYRYVCCNEMCVRLEHLRCGKRGDQLRRRAALGLAGHRPSTRANLTLAARNRSTTKYTPQQAKAVRDLAAAGVPDPLIGWATDVGAAMVADMRRGKAWAEQTGLASVFAWRPTP